MSRCPGETVKWLCPLRAPIFCSCGQVHSEATHKLQKEARLATLRSTAFRRLSLGTGEKAAPQNTGCCPPTGKEAAFHQCPPRGIVSPRICPSLLNSPGACHCQLRRCYKHHVLEAGVPDPVVGGLAPPEASSPCPRVGVPLCVSESWSSFLIRSPVAVD